MLADQKFCSPLRLTHLDAQILRYETDPGSAGNPPSAVCDASVTNPISCGDGLVNAGLSGSSMGKEECDDGNTANGDGCSSSCTTEDGWTCPRYGYRYPAGTTTDPNVPGYLNRPMLICRSEDVTALTGMTAGAATAYAFCRGGVTQAECGLWCSSADGVNAGCKGFNYYANAWGVANMCCFRKGVGTMEFHTNTQCYEKEATSTDANCADDTNFKDEHGFMCHEWMGYNCESAVTDYGYTAGAQVELLAKCKSACGFCSGNKCRPTCSVIVTSPSLCPDCQGRYRSADTCVRGNVAQKPDGKTQCVVEKLYEITKAAQDGGANCSQAAGDKAYEVVDIYTPGPWSACSSACGGLAGTQTRPIPTCQASENICSTFGQDFVPATEQACMSGPCAGGSKATASGSVAASFGSFVAALCISCLFTLTSPRA